MLNLTEEIKDNRQLALREKVRFRISSTPGNPFVPKLQLFAGKKQSQHSEPTEEMTLKLSGEAERELATQILNRQVELFEKAVKRYPNNPQLLNNLGLSFLNASNIDQAINCFKKALTIRPDLVPTKLNLAKAYLVSGNLASALSMYEALTTEQPDNLVLHMNLAELYLRSAVAGDREALAKTITHLLKIIERQPGNAAAQNNLGIAFLLNQDIKAAIGCFKKALAENPRSSFGHFNVGVCYFINKQYQKAAVHFASSLMLDSRNVETAKSLAAAELKLRHYDKVLAVLEGYKNDASNDFEYLHLLSEAYFYKGNYRQSLDILRLIVQRIEPGDPKTVEGHTVSDAEMATLARAYNNIGCVYGMLRDLGKAESFFLKSANLDRDKEAQALFNLANLYLVQRKLVEAKNVIDQLQLSYSDNTKLPFVKGRYLFLLKKYDEALTELQKTIVLDPTNERAYGLMGHIWAEVKRDNAKAIEIVQQGLKRIPSSGRLLNNFAYSNLMMGNLGAARDALDRIKEADSLTDICATATRGLLLIKQGAVDLGAGLYTRAAELATDSETKNLVRQKRSLELGRWHLQAGQLSKAKKYLTEVGSINTSWDTYALQARELLDTLSG